MTAIKKQLINLIAKQLKTSSGETYAEILKREVDRLYDCIQARIDEYYRNYNPSAYQRTYRFRGALYAEKLIDIKVVGNQIQLSLRFNPDLAHHRNVFDNHDSYVPILMNFGWKAKRLEQTLGIRQRFTRFGGIHFIENGIDDWNRANKLGITIDVTAIYNGKQFSLF